MGMAPPQMQAEPTIIRGCSAAGIASSASAPASRLTMAWTSRPLRRLEPGMQGQVISNGAHCPTCQGNMVVSGPVMSHDAHAPGYAVVGGPAGPRRRATPSSVKRWSAPSPVPVGVSKMRNARRDGSSHGRDGWSPGRRAARSVGRPDQSAAGPGRRGFAALHNRPHIISHLFGLPMFGQYRREREDRERQKHASIAYGQSDRPVTELPASVVYGKDDH